MNATDLRLKSDDELKDQLVGLRKEAFNLRFQAASGQLENTARVGQVRRDIATHMLKKSRLPLEEVALSLGFSELSTFHRAFRRWTGLAPGEFRERHAAFSGAR